MLRQILKSCPYDLWFYKPMVFLPLAFIPPNSFRVHCSKGYIRGHVTIMNLNFIICENPRLDLLGSEINLESTRGETQASGVWTIPALNETLFFRPWIYPLYLLPQDDLHLAKQMVPSKTTFIYMNLTSQRTCVGQKKWCQVMLYLSSCDRAKLTPAQVSHSQTP